MPAKTLADAALDRRVARADARDKYRATIQAARRQLARDYLRAETGWIRAAGEARSQAQFRRALRARFREMRPDQLRDELAQLTYMLTPQYAVNMERADKDRAALLIRMIRAELGRPERDVS